MPGVNLTADEAKRILGFIGYGRPAGSIWFIGLEEGLGGQNKLDHVHNAKARGAWDEVMDLERAHLLLVERGQPMRIAVSPPGTQTWLWMGKICRALAGNQDWSDPNLAKNYIRQRLGRADPAIGETFLTEPSPIPAKKSGLDKCWRNALQQAIPDIDRLIWQRRLRLRSLIDRHQPESIFCYGAKGQEANAEFKKLLPVQSWRRVGKKTEIGEIDGRTAALMPFFGNRRISTAECATVISEVMTWRSQSSSRLEGAR